jgi:hypothetical protein
MDEAVDRSKKAVSAREAPTVADLYKRYAAEHLPFKAPRAAADDRSMWTTYILPAFDGIKVAKLTHRDVDGKRDVDHLLPFMN